MSKDRIETADWVVFRDGCVWRRMAKVGLAWLPAGTYKNAVEAMKGGEPVGIQKKKKA